MDNRRVYRIVLATWKEGTRIASLRASEGTCDRDLSLINAVGRGSPEPRRDAARDIVKGQRGMLVPRSHGTRDWDLSLIDQFEQSTPTICDRACPLIHQFKHSTPTAAVGRGSARAAARRGA